jgi:hypothetical protein
MKPLFRGGAVQTVFPAFIRRLVERFLQDMPERPKQARGKEAGYNHHDEFLRESALHAIPPKQIPCR